MTALWPPFREPVRATARTFGLVVPGALLARWCGGLARGRSPYPDALPSLGGHPVEVWFPWLRPRIPPSRRGLPPARRLVRRRFCSVSALTATMLGVFRSATWPPWWLAGIAFTGTSL
jgi:hypothetical protein